MGRTTRELLETPDAVAGLPKADSDYPPRIASLCERHTARCGADTAAHIVSAPGRTEMAGNHTDHNHGRVLCSAVGLDTLGVITARSDTLIRIDSEGYDGLIEVDVSDLEPHDDERGLPQALVRGVAAAFSDASRPVTGFDATVSSEVAPGSGLSSSASFEVFLGTVLTGLGTPEQDRSSRLSAADVLFIATAGKSAENRYFGKPCGLMDQLACAHGGIISIDFSSDPPSITPADFDFSTAGYAPAVIDTGGSHADLTDDYASVPAEMKSVAAELGGTHLGYCSKDVLLRRVPEIRERCGDRAVLRALHFFEENARVAAMIDALEAGEAERFLELANESGDSSAILLQNYYSTKLPAEQGITLGVELARSFFETHGVSGAARVHGGGFAGTVQVYIPLGLWKEFVEVCETVFGAGAVTRLRLRPEGPRFLTP